MHPRVQQTFHEILREREVRPRRALELGGTTGRNSLLRFDELRGAERVCLNLIETRDRYGIRTVVGNGNDMSVFEDASFDLVMSNATLEHDKYFWKSLAEMKRVLAPGGLLVIGAPGYRKNPRRDHGRSTHTYRVHYRFDYYRFSEQAFREVFFEGMEDVEVQAILAPPRIVGHGFKPGGERPVIARAQPAAERVVPDPVPAAAAPRAGGGSTQVLARARARAARALGGVRGRVKGS
jgi:SAM-dependent methyltransferase